MPAHRDWTRTPGQVGIGHAGGPFPSCVWATFERPGPAPCHEDLLKPWPRRFAGLRQRVSSDGARLAGRPCGWLFGFHADVLLRLAPSGHRRGSAHPRRHTAGGLASSYAGPVLRFYSRTLQRRWSASGASPFRSLQPDTAIPESTHAIDPRMAGSDVARAEKAPPSLGRPSHPDTALGAAS